MIKKWNILVPIGCRSDKGLSAPIIKRLEKQNWCNVETYEIAQPGNYMNTFLEIINLVPLDQVDLCLITGDRIEMMACTEACFLNHVKIAHFYAGIITNRATFDGIHRHCITMMADIAFCEDDNSGYKVKELWEAIGKLDPYSYDGLEDFEDLNIHIVGISHLDDLEIDESLVPNEDYDLISMNPTTLMEDLHEFNSLDFYFENPIFIAPNPDPTIFPLGYELPLNCKHYDTLPRPQFLGLLKFCKRFITNSSCAYYEAPYFLDSEQIIQVGLRNKNRSTPKKLETGASDKIVKILEEYFKNEFTI